MTLDEIAKKWDKKSPTPNEWAAMEEFEAAVLLRREILSDFAYRGYHSDLNKLLDQCKEAVHAVRNSTFNKPKYKIVTKYKHGCTIDAGGAFYITWDLKVLGGAAPIKYEGKYDLQGTFGCFPEWTVSPVAYRTVLPYIGRDHIAEMLKEAARLWDEMAKAIPAAMAKHLKSGKVEDLAVQKFASIIGILGNNASLEMIQILLRHLDNNGGDLVKQFFESCRRNSATIDQLNDAKVIQAWDLAGVQKVMKD